MAKNSGRAINYQLRPAKNIERKMIRDAALRLFSFSPLSEYQYIGFGAKYFTDFFIIHRYLHIEKMISIENEVDKKEKYEFNKPFSCIEMKYGDAGEILPKLDWGKRTITWLDYDKRFSQGVLNDIDTVMQNCISGSMVLLSFNSCPHKTGHLQEEFNSTDRLFERKIRGEVGDRYFPSDFKEQGMSKWTNYSNTLRKAIQSRVEDTLSGRNSQFGELDPEYMNIKQILYFDYKDGVEMSTVGYMVYSNKERSNYLNCLFEHLDFYRDDDNSFVIDVPNFTMKEIKELMQKLPDLDKKLLSNAIFPPADIEKFSKIYKYFPNFIDAEHA